jgi:hypothetical protein
MATLAKLTSEQLREARKAGFKRKAPKKPKRGATLASMEAYVARHNEFVKEAKHAVSAYKKRAHLAKAINGY